MISFSQLSAHLNQLQSSVVASVFWLMMTTGFASGPETLPGADLVFVSKPAPWSSTSYLVQDHPCANLHLDTEAPEPDPWTWSSDNMNLRSSSPTGLRSGLESEGGNPTVALVVMVLPQKATASILWRVQRFSKCHPSDLHSHDLHECKLVIHYSCHVGVSKKNIIFDIFYHLKKFLRAYRK